MMEYFQKFSLIKLRKKKEMEKKKFDKVRLEQKFWKVGMVLYL